MEDILRNYLKTHERQMFELLEKLVRINSGSHDKPGVDAVGRAIAAALAGCHLVNETVAFETAGDTRVFRSAAPCRDRRQILLVGHMDTVFNPGTDFTGYREDDECAYGPGVIDMKGGLVTGIFALRALAAAGLLNRIPLAFVCTGDEEIGSPWSRALIQKEAEKSRFALVLEVGGLNGEVVTGRKGNLSARLTFSGQSGHAAFAGPDKPSAIVEMAHQILAIEALNDPSTGITANVGAVTGGIGPNTVAAHAEARLDCRFVDPADGERLKARLSRICGTPHRPGVRCRLEILSGRPPMPASDANQRLYRRIRDIAKRLQIAVSEEFRAGVSDANYIAPLGIPVIDGLGPIGGEDHSPREYMRKDSLHVRTLLLACMLAGQAMGQ